MRETFELPLKEWKEALNISDYASAMLMQMMADWEIDLTKDGFKVDVREFAMYGMKNPEIQKAYRELLQKGYVSSNFGYATFFTGKIMNAFEKYAKDHNLTTNEMHNSNKTEYIEVNTVYEIDEEIGF